jgi:hypothetical protein
MIMNKNSIIQIGYPLMIENEFSTNAYFEHLKSLGDHATKLWTLWEDSDDFPIDRGPS